MLENHSQNEQAKTAAESTLKREELPDETRKSERFPTFRALGKSGKQFWKKNRRGFLILLLVLAVTHASLNIYASVLLNRELGEIRQKSEPLTLTELAPPAVPASQDAAPIYKQATTALRLTRQEESLLAKSLISESSSGRATLAVLQKNRRAIQLARQAASRPGCRFPIDWNASPHQILFPHYGDVRQLARMLAAQSLQSARSGDVNGALRDARAIFAISDHLKNEPTVIGFFVARAINAMAYNTLATVLETTPISASQARSFRASLPQTDWNATYRRAMLGERTFTLWGFNVVRSNWREANQAFTTADTPGPMRWIASPLGLLWTPFLKLDEVYSLRSWKGRIAAITPMKVPAPPDTAGTSEMDFQNAPRYAVITRILFPVFGRSREYRDTIEVSQREMEIALALSTYRSTNGRYPTQLEQVAPLWGKTLPTDPYSNKPFIYQSDGRNFTLYSIGANRSDDKGHGPAGRYNEGGRSQSPGDDILWNSRPA